METIGMELKIKRIRARVTQRALADRMGVSHPRVSIIENSSGLRADTVTRYLEALDYLTTQTTSGPKILARA